MPGSRSAALLQQAVELERRDDAVAAQGARVAELAGRAGSVRMRAAETCARLDALPAELAAIESAETDARAAERDAREELAGAEARVAELEGARHRKEEDAAQAQRSAQSAREAFADAMARIARLGSRRDDLHDVERALRAEVEGLAVEAREIAAGIREVPRVSDAGKLEPGASLEEIEEWGGRARTALFVVGGVLDAERERIVAEANALGASVLGEELPGANVALVRRRLEAVLGD